MPLAFHYQGHESIFLSYVHTQRTHLVTFAGLVNNILYTSFPQAVKSAVMSRSWHSPLEVDLSRLHYGPSDGRKLINHSKPQDLRQHVYGKDKVYSTFQ